MCPSPTPALPTVLLLHECPDGTRHVDWMIAREPQGREPLMTFRLPQRVDELVQGQRLSAQRIADHRPKYLSYEGPLSGDRGSVSLLGRGLVVSLQQQADAWQVEVLWHSRPGAPRYQWLRLQRRDADDWIIVSEAPESSGRREPQGEEP